jgi:hypothetical protein
MRTRRSFQPMLDSMPSRIAPSAIGGPVLLAAPTGPAMSAPITQVTVHPCDTNMPETGSSTPIRTTN